MLIFLAQSMLKKIKFIYYLLGVGCCVIIFNAGCIVLGFIILPLIGLLTGDESTRAIKVQRSVHLACKLLVSIIAFLRLARISVVNDLKKGVDGSALVIANHPTLLDVVFILSVFEQLDLIAKAQLWKNSFLCNILRQAGYLKNADGADPEALLAECTERLKAGRNLLVFPEGTRSAPGQIGKFHRGPAALALRSGSKVLPIVISCDPPILTKDRKWYWIPERDLSLRLQIFNYIDINSVAPSDAAECLNRRHLTQYFQNFYRDRLVDE